MLAESNLPRPTQRAAGAGMIYPEGQKSRLIFGLSREGAIMGIDRDHPRHHVIAWGHKDYEGRTFDKEYRTSGDAIRSAKQAASEGWTAYACSVRQFEDCCTSKLLWASFDPNGERGAT